MPLSLSHSLAGLLFVFGLSVETLALAYPYVTAEPQKTGWPLLAVLLLAPLAALRCVWGNAPPVSLYGRTDLRVEPFRTDDWKP